MRDNVDKVKVLVGRKRLQWSSINMYQCKTYVYIVIKLKALNTTFKMWQSCLSKSPKISSFKISQKPETWNSLLSSPLCCPHLFNHTFKVHVLRCFELCKWLSEPPVYVGHFTIGILNSTILIIYVTTNEYFNTTTQINTTTTVESLNVTIPSLNWRSHWSSEWQIFLWYN